MRAGWARAASVWLAIQLSSGLGQSDTNRSQRICFRICILAQRLSQRKHKTPWCGAVTSLGACPPRDGDVSPTGSTGGDSRNALNHSTFRAIPPPCPQCPQVFTHTHGFTEHNYSLHPYNSFRFLLSMCSFLGTLGTLARIPLVFMVFCVSPKCPHVGDTVGTWGHLTPPCRVRGITRPQTPSVA